MLYNIVYGLAEVRTYHEIPEFLQTLKKKITDKVCHLQMLFIYQFIYLFTT